MQNVVRLRPARTRPERIFEVPRSGARILFFTGVRYVRDAEAAPAAPSRRDARHPARSEQRLDATGH